MKKYDPYILTICVFAYNHEDQIAKAVKSVLYQDTNFKVEFLVGEDGSSDNTLRVVEQISEEFGGKIRIVIQDQDKKIFINGMATGRWNFVNLLNRSKGKYVALLDGDDCWTDRLKLQKQVDFLEAHPRIGACFTNAIIHDHISNQKREYNEAHGLKEGIVFNELIYRIGGSIYPTCTLVFRKELLNQIDLSAHGMAGDEQLIFAIANISKVYYMDFISGVYNRWQGGAFSGIKDDKKKLLTYRKGEIKGYRKFGKQLTPENKALLNKKKITAIDYVLQNSSGILPILKYAPDNGIKKTIRLLHKKWRNHYSRS